VSAVAVPEAMIERRGRGWSWAWVVPVLALVGVGLFLFVHVSRSRGPTVVISFADAGGVQPGAELLHRGLRVGVVRDVRLAPDLDGVEVWAELLPHAAGLAAEGSSFWIVRPEVSLDRVSGLDTLLGPRYVRVRPGSGPPRARFVGLEFPPAPEPGTGLAVTLRAASAGSLLPGSPVLYRGLPVGRVTGLSLSDDGTHVRVSAAIEPGRAGLVRENTRFWNAGGVGVDFGLFRGLSVQAGSLDAVFRGGVGLATPTKAGRPAVSGAEFELADKPESEWLSWTPVLDVVGP
jgi:paraquat-inducible protein B